ncbi:MAG: response regulator [Oscillospiraceae bacterium]|nr:response regulator [Oscillospiraceae bacterium]
MRILIVDDSVMSCGQLVRMTSMLFKDADIHYVLDAQKALKYLEQNKTDIVLTDVDMPYIDGFELEHLIREQFPDVCVYFETGTTPAYMKSMGIPAGKCLFKPFTGKALQDLLSDWLQ